MNHDLFLCIFMQCPQSPKLLYYKDKKWIRVYARVFVLMM